MSDFKETKRIFETNIVTNSKVYSFSDIHADMDYLIVLLRDCAKVIRKKPLDRRMRGGAADDVIHTPANVRDPELEDLLNRPLDARNAHAYNVVYDDSKPYIADLNYEWCGNQSYVVIAGDIIDGNRLDVNPPHNELGCKKLDNVTPCIYYPQIELKILLFINAINKQAIANGGRIIKLLGNHEITNINGDRNGWNASVSSWIFAQDTARHNNYYVNNPIRTPVLSTARLNIFKYGQYGYDLLFEDGAGVLVVINNVIYVHGGLTGVSRLNTFNSIQAFNNRLNELNNPDVNNKNIVEDLIVDNFPKFQHLQFGDQDILWNRLYDDSRISPLLMSKHIQGNPARYNKYCSDLQARFNIFKANSPLQDANNLIMVVGHCPNFYRTAIKDGYGITHSQVKPTRHNNIDKFEGAPYEGPPNLANKGTIFGISMECEGNVLENDVPTGYALHNHKIYHIDVGSSRSFDDRISSFITNINSENKYLYSRTPSVVQINLDRKIILIKSKMSNTRTHMPRYDYEKSIDDRKIDELRNIPGNPNYAKKYLKYKMKYLIKK